jgi:superfamily II DNA/RNA helicase
LQHTATCCNTLQYTATHCNTPPHLPSIYVHRCGRTARGNMHTHAHTQTKERVTCNTLQRTAAHCNTLQHTAARCNTLQHSPSIYVHRPGRAARGDIVRERVACSTLQHTQHTAAHCNALQHNVAYCNTLSVNPRLSLWPHSTW